MTKQSSSSTLDEVDAEVVKPKPPKRRAVFEGTIGGVKMLIDARADTLITLAEITGMSPKEYADEHNMVIINRAKANPDVVRSLKKLWGAAKLEEYKLLQAQKKLRREAERLERVERLNQEKLNSSVRSDKSNKSVRSKRSSD